MGVGWRLGKVVTVLPKGGGYFLRQAEAGGEKRRPEDVFLSSSLLHKSILSLKVGT